MSLQIFSVKLGINYCYIIKDKGLVMVDSGPPGRGEEIKKFLDSIAVKSEELQLVILTHGDFDHTGSAGDIREITGAKIAIHKRDKSNLEEGRFNWPPGITPWGKFSHFLFAPFFKHKKFPSAKADITLTDEDSPLNEYGIDGKIIYTPGHTAGSVSVLLRDGEAFVGCLAHNNIPFRLSPGLPIYGEDLARIKESWKNLISQGARMIYPGHGHPFKVEEIKNYLN
jgi:hydroxyacylglutathione hydrolase